MKPTTYKTKYTHIKIFLQDKTLYAPEVISRLQTIANHNKINNPIIGLPDIHYKIGNFIPTGSVIATNQDHIIPCAVGNGAGCGYSIIKIDTNPSIVKKQIEPLFQKLLKNIPIKNNQPQISESQLQTILTQGIDSCPDADSTIKSRINFAGNIFANNPNFQPDYNFKKYFPTRNYQGGLTQIPMLGGGNHFIELVEIINIFQPNAAKWFNLKKGDLLLTMHADANQIADISRTFTPYKTFKNWQRIKQELKKISFHLKFYKHPLNYLKQNQLFTLKTNSTAGRKFLSFIFATTNYGFVNRFKLYQKIKKTAQELSINCQFFVDNIHDLISYENQKWIHRTGASIATPPNQSQTPYFNKYGKPLLIPGALSKNSFIMLPTPQSKTTYYSLNHGAGRIIDRSQATNFSTKDIEQTMQTTNIKLYRKGTFDISKEHHQAFKNITSIIDNMEQLNIAQKLVELKPLAILKG